MAWIGAGYPDRGGVVGAVAGSSPSEGLEWAREATRRVAPAREVRGPERSAAVRSAARGARGSSETTEGSVRKLEDLAASAAVLAGEHVDFVDALHQLGPGVPTRPLGWRAAVVSGVGVRFRGACRGRCMSASALRRLGRSWHDALSERRGGGEDAVVCHEVDPWSRDERREPCDQVERVEYDVGRAIAELLLQLVDDLGAVGGERHPLVDDRWPERRMRRAFRACRGSRRGSARRRGVRSPRRSRRACRVGTAPPSSVPRPMRWA